MRSASDEPPPDAAPRVRGYPSCEDIRTLLLPVSAVMFSLLRLPVFILNDGFVLFDS